MLTKLLTILGLIVGQPKDKLPYGVVYVPPAKAGKGAKVVIIKRRVYNPLDKIPLIEPPEFYYPPLEIDPPVTQVADTFFIPDPELDEPAVISAP